MVSYFIFIILTVKLEINRIYMLEDSITEFFQLYQTLISQMLLGFNPTTLQFLQVYANFLNGQYANVQTK